MNIDDRSNSTLKSRDLHVKIILITVGELENNQPMKVF